MTFGAFPLGAVIAGVLNLFPLVSKAQSFSGNAGQGMPSKEKTRYSGKCVQGLMRKMSDGAGCVRSEGELTCSTVIIRNGQL